MHKITVETNLVYAKCAVSVEWSISSSHSVLSAILFTPVNRISLSVSLSLASVLVRNTSDPVVYLCECLQNASLIRTFYLFL